MNHRTPSPSPSPSTPTQGDRRPAGPGFLRALALLLALAGAAPGLAEGGTLVAEVTKTGYDGHPYHWSPPDC